MEEISVHLGTKFGLLTNGSAYIRGRRRISRSLDCNSWRVVTPEGVEGKTIIEIAQAVDMSYVTRRHTARACLARFGRAAASSKRQADAV
jgi:hypothetical protein